MSSLPEVELPKEGSGKRGNVIKLDLAICLVKALFPMASSEEQLQMVSKMMRRTGETVKDHEAVLDYIEQLDEQNKTAFKELKSLAKECREEVEETDMDFIRTKLGMPSRKTRQAQSQDAGHANHDAATEGANASKKREHEDGQGETQPQERAPKRSHVTPLEFKEPCALRKISEPKQCSQ